MLVFKGARNLFSYNYIAMVGIPTRLNLVSSIKYLPATGVSVPILNELTYIIATQVGFIR